MMNLRLCIKRKLTFALTFTLFFCALLVFAAEVRADGNVSADVIPEPPIKKSVRRAPVKRAPQRASQKTPAKSAASKKQKPATQPPKPPQPSSLEMGIRMMEQERYEQARSWLQKAVQEERNNPYAWYWYGVAHDKAGQYQQAQFFYAKALAIDPAFSPFSRVVTYPDDGDRRVLWDPQRPARIFPVEAGDQDVTIVPPDAPEATPRPLMPPVDPTLPKVPIYVPPEVPSVPGDALQPPVYVPPSFYE